MKNGGLMKNNSGRVRWVWVVVAAYALYSACVAGATTIAMDILRSILTATGDISADGAVVSSFAGLLDENVLPVAFSILQDVVIVGIVLVFWVGLLRKPWRGLGFPSWPLRSCVRQCALGVLFGAAFLVVALLVVSALGRVDMRAGGAAPSLWLAWLAAMAAVAVAEEVLYRGFVMGVVRRDHGERYAVVASAVVFGLIHVTNPEVTVGAIANIVLAGVLLAFLYAKTGSLWMSIGFHFAWNALQGLVFGVPVSGLRLPSIMTTSVQGDGLLTGGAFGFEASIVVTIGYGAIVTLMLLRGRSKKKHPAMNE